MIRKADIILGVILIIIGLIATWGFTRDNNTGATVHVQIDGESYGTYDISENQTVDIRQDNNINKITITDGTVSMSFSNCNNQDCVKHSPISKTSESIICLPHKVIVEIEGSDSEFDAIAK